MKNWKRFTSLLLALVLCLSLMACGGETGEEVTVTLVNQSGQSITSLAIAATDSDSWGSELVDWVFLDGEMMDRTLGSFKPSRLPGFNILAYGEAGSILYDINAEFTLHDGDYVVFQSPEDNPGITICTADEFDALYADYAGGGDEDPDIYTGTDSRQPGDLSDVVGLWYYQGDQNSAFALILTLYSDGTYTRGDTEEGTYTYEEYDEYVTNWDTTVFRQEVALSGSLNEIYYLTSDGQVLEHWADGDNYYIREDALGNTDLTSDSSLTDGSFWGEDYTLQFLWDYTVRCDFFSGETRTGTWEMYGDTVMIFWDDGETDEALVSGNTLWLSSTGETLESFW